MGLAEAGQGRGRWPVHRLAVDDTPRWLEMCGVADLIWLESPSNPLLAVGDLDVICAAPRKPGAILSVENTFATPLNQRPLPLGADVSVQSATKFLGGHSDLLAGVVTVRVRGDVAAADAVCAGLRLIHHATSLGAVESTIERRASVSGQQHLPPTLLRLSVGIERVEDLWPDLDRALRHAQ